MHTKLFRALHFAKAAANHATSSTTCHPILHGIFAETTTHRKKRTWNKLPNNYTTYTQQRLQDPDGQHYRKVATRVFGDLEFRCSVRPITEEFMLAGFGYASEPTAAECIRSFPVVPFVGCEWLTWLDGVK